MKKIKKAFTLAEVLSVVIILGVVATITIPSTVRRARETQNRAKIKKAMTAYENLLNRIISENGIRSNDELRSYIGISRNRRNICRERILPNFKIIQSSDNENRCQIMTTDKLWWDVTDIANPIISFEAEDLTQDKANELSTNKAFYLHGSLDDNGSVRINDYQFEKLKGTSSNYTKMVKLYNYIENKKTSMKGTLNECKELGIHECVLDADTVYHKFYGLDIYVSDIQAKNKLQKSDATSAENCATSEYEDCSTIGDYLNLAKTTCKKQGGHLPSFEEMQSLANADPNLTLTKTFITDSMVPTNSNFYTVSKTPTSNFVGYGNYTGKPENFICIQD